MARDTDARAVSLVDLPLIRRLSDKATLLDSEIAFTREINVPNGTVLSNILLPQQRGHHTLIARSDKRQVVGQFRFRAESDNAFISYLAPYLAEGDDDTVWLHILDAMAREAGKFNAHALIAEVEEDSSLFETMRTAGFAVYARQQIWRREPDAAKNTETTIELTEKTENDEPGIQSLVATTLPPLLQQIAAPPPDLPGMLYRRNDKTQAYVAVSEGKNGIYLIPYVHPDAAHRTADIILSTIAKLPKSEKLPVYMCVRRYHEWMASTLKELGFEPGPRQAVMVKHLTAGVRHATFEPVKDGLHVVAGPAKPPGRS